MNDKQGAAGAFAGAGLISLVLIAPHARADDYFSPTDERVQISLGAMHVSSATTIQADSSAGVQGTVIDAENQFGLKKADTEPKFQATVRIDTRNRLTFDYFTLDRTGNAVVPATGSPIIFRDVTLLPTDPLQTQLSLRTFGISYGYSFWHSEKVEIAATVGVHSTQISSTVKVQTETRHVIQTEDQAGAVPTVGIDATWVASKRFYFDARAQYLEAHVDNVKGSLGIYEFDALYRLRPNVSFAIGYMDIRAKLTSTQSSDGGEFDLSTKGPELFVRIAF
jgi:outer membrane protein W